MTRNQLAAILAKYLPNETILAVADELIANKVHLKITKPRVTKYGDFKIPRNGEQHRISVNSNLNPWAFLVTLLHELAHLYCWEKHGPMVGAHGSHWKEEFRQILQPYHQQNVFPPDLSHAIGHYISNPKASSCSSPLLMKALANYDQHTGAVMLDIVETGMMFSTENGRIFKKGEKRRTRFLCTDMKTGRAYLVHSVAKVIVVSDK